MPGTLKAIASNRARAQTTAANNAFYSQELLDRITLEHEMFLRRVPGGQGALLRFVNCQDRRLSGRDLSEADFTGANLSRAKLVRSKFTCASLFCALLIDVDARQTDFHRADLRGASLRQADLRGARLDDADMRQAILAQADVQRGFRVISRIGADLGDGDCAYAVDFRDASLKGARLGAAKLRGANFAGANMTGADLRGANLLGAVFDGAILSDVDVAAARIDEASLTRAILAPNSAAHARTAELSARIADAETWVRSAGSEGRPADLDDEDLRPLRARLANRLIAGLSAQRACAIGVSFAGTQLQGARFDGADLRDADFSGADLRGASFRGANLWHADFALADLRPLPLASGGGRPADFDGARFGEGALEHAIRH